MSGTDAEFYASLRTMLSLSLSPFLTDKFPPQDTHNIGTRLLRHGLSVSAFSLLEKYVEQKFSELISAVAKSKIPYAAHSDELRKFITVDAISGLANRLYFQNASDKQYFAETNISLIASFSNPAPNYTSLGFSPRGSNVGHDDITQAFIACGVEKPWKKLLLITNGIGAGRLSLLNDYKSLAKTRHNSAHNPGDNVPTSDLRTHLETAILIGIAVAGLSSAAASAYAKAKTVRELKSALDNVSPSYRFIDEQQDGKWLERSYSTGCGYKRYPDEITAVQGAKARKDKRMVVCRDIQRVPIAVA